MGIQNLNKFFLSKCTPSSIRKTHLSELSGRTIVVDTSIYLYKFVADNTLLEHFYLMISIFRHYNIVPIFVFDGKPPKEKMELLLKRRKHRQKSEEEYHKLKEQYETMENENDKMSLIKEMTALKRESTSISYNHLNDVKTLMTAYGVKYLQAEGEADILCIQLVDAGHAWGCMSDDMDMFVYGCPRVFRHFSLSNHDIMFYDTHSILSDLNMDIQSFREMAVLSGTDYTASSQKMSADCLASPENAHIISMFDINKYTENESILKHLDPPAFGEIVWESLSILLQKEGFVFIN
jgi:flap endonuclease-1